MYCKIIIIYVLVTFLWVFFSPYAFSTFLSRGIFLTIQLQLPSSYQKRSGVGDKQNISPRQFWIIRCDFSLCKAFVILGTKVFVSDYLS